MFMRGYGKHNCIGYFDVLLHFAAAGLLTASAAAAALLVCCRCMQLQLVSQLQHSLYQ
jgi:hypothetical protein